MASWRIAEKASPLAGTCLPRESPISPGLTGDRTGVTVNILVVVGDPVDHFPAVPAKVLRRHVVAFLLDIPLPSSLAGVHRTDAVAQGTSLGVSSIHSQ